MTFNLQSYLSEGSEAPDGQLVGVGVDVIHLHRLARAMKRNPLFFDRLAHTTEHPEWTSYDSIGLAWAGYLWTGKEAVAKALKTGVWREGIDWPDLCVGYWIDSFEGLKEHLSPWHDLFYPSCQLETVSNSLPLHPTWIKGSVELVGPALSKRKDLHFRHLFSLTSPHSKSDPHPLDQPSLPRLDRLEDHQALSIVYAWTTHPH